MPSFNTSPSVYQGNSGEHFKWAHNAADYKCKVCPNFVTRVKNTFQFHIKSNHGLTSDTYRAQYGSLSDYERRHICKICGRQIAWHASNLAQHLGSCHGFSLKDYYDTYIRNTEDANHVKEEKLQVSQSQVPRAQLHAPKPHFQLPQSQLQVQQYQLQVQQSQAQVQQSQLQVQKAPLQVPNSINPKKWMDRCIFECKICSVRFDSRANFKSHLQSIHNLLYENYKADFPDSLVVMDLHCCLMCQESIICDGEEISEHLNLAHAISLDDYHDRFIANDRTIATVKKQTNSLCRNWDQFTGQVHHCLMCSEQLQFAKDILEIHMKSHGIDLRIYEKRFRYELDAIFNNHDITIDHGDHDFTEEDVQNNDEIQNDDDDDDFGSVFEDEEELELDEEEFRDETDPFMDVSENNVDSIQSPEDIDDIDIEENVDYITDAL